MSYTDEKLQVFVLSKLYDYNANQTKVNSFRQDPLFEKIDEKQLNFCFQYLTTGGFIESAYTNSQGFNHYYPHIITNKGIDLVNNLVSSKKLNKLLEYASTNIDKITLLISKILDDPSIWDIIREVYEKLLKLFLGIE